MKKKTKKPLFDPRCPGAKMLFYGAILLLIAGCINAYTTWVFVVGVYMGMVTAGDVMGYTLVICAQVALAFIVAIDAINNRNRPSKARGVLVKTLCVFIIAGVVAFQGTSGEGASGNIVTAALSLAGSAVIGIGAFLNAKVLKKQ